jgi:hypothetical protein
MTSPGKFLINISTQSMRLALNFDLNWFNVSNETTELTGYD